MKYTIQSGQDDITQSVEELLTKKLDKVGQQFDWVIGADVFFKKEEDVRKSGFICEIRLSVPGPRLFASSSATSYEAALADTMDALTRQLKKRKDEFADSRK